MTSFGCGQSTLPPDLIPDAPLPATIRTPDLRLGSVRFRHQVGGPFLKHRVAEQALAFSADNKLIYSGGKDGTIREWDVSSGDLKRTFVGHEGIVRVLTLLSDGKMIASGGEDGTVRLWDLSSGKELWQVKAHSDRLVTLSFSKDGSTLISASCDGTVRVLDAINGREIRRLVESKYQGWAIALFSPDGKTVVTMADNDAVIRLWNVADWSEFRQIGKNRHRGEWLAFSPDGRRLLESGSVIGLVLWDIATGKESPLPRKSRGVYEGIAFAPDGKQFVSVGSPSEHIPAIWDVATGKPTMPLSGHYRSVNAVVYSPDGKLIATGGDDGVIRLFDASGDQIRPPDGHQSRVSSLAITADAKVLVSGGWDRTVRLWELPSGKPIRTLTWDLGKEPWFSQSTVNSVSLSGDGKLLASSDFDGPVRIWAMENGQLLRSIERNQRGAGAVVLTRRGEAVLLGGMDGTLGVWDVNTGKQLKMFENLGGIRRLVLTPDEEIFAAPGSIYPPVIEFRSFQSGAVTTRISLTDERPANRITSEDVFFAFSGEGKILATARENRDGGIRKPLRLFNVATGKELLSLPESGWTTSLAINADGKKVAVASGDGVIAVWHTSTMERKEWFATDQWGIRNIIFSPDGKWLYSGGENGTICGWKLQP
jgi:WD40 repeat protein